MARGREASFVASRALTPPGELESDERVRQGRPTRLRRHANRRCVLYLALKDAGAIVVWNPGGIDAALPCVC